MYADRVATARTRATATAIRHRAQQRGLFGKDAPLQSVGNQALLRHMVRRSPGPGGNASRLVIGSAADPQEAAADRVAERMTSGGTADYRSGGGTSSEDWRGRSLMRTTPAGDKEFAGPRSNAFGSGSGHALDPAARAFFEPHFGDLSAVRVHDDGEAAETAAAIGARAYTAGTDIGFAPGEYAPGSSEGRRLLAHELVHVAQGGHVIRRQPVSTLPQTGTPGGSAAHSGSGQPDTTPDTDKGNSPPDAVVHTEIRGNVLYYTATIHRDGMYSRLERRFDLTTWDCAQRLYRKDDHQNPSWVDVTQQALQADYLNPDGTPKGVLSVEWNMPAQQPKQPAIGVGYMAAEAAVSEIPPSLVIPYVKDSILVENFEFTPPGENPYQHWADTIGRRWAATGARKAGYWYNKLVSVVGEAVAATGVVTATGKGASAIKAAAEAEALASRQAVRLLQRFDLDQPLATVEEMVEGVRELETGTKPGLGSGPALPETRALTDLQRRALGENVRRIIVKTIPAVKAGAGPQSLVNQLANPRFRFLWQLPAARAALIDALKGTGVSLPASL